jgi:hypothetical protein
MDVCAACSPVAPCAKPVDFLFDVSNKNRDPFLALAKFAEYGVTPYGARYCAGKSHLPAQGKPFTPCFFPFLTQAEVLLIEMLRFHDTSLGRNVGVMKLLLSLQGFSAYFNAVSLGQHYLCIINGMEGHPVLLDENF